MIPYIRKLEKNKFEIILVFLKWFLLDFIKAAALFDLLKFVWILFDFTKMFTLLEIFFWKFWYIICLYNILLYFHFLSFFSLFKKMLKKTLSSPTGPAQLPGPATAQPTLLVRLVPEHGTTPAAARRRVRLGYATAAALPRTLLHVSPAP